jgi:hypothetical protein
LLRRVEQDCDRLNQAFSLTESGHDQLNTTVPSVSLPPPAAALAISQQPSTKTASQSSETSRAAPGPILPSHYMAKQNSARQVDPYRAAMKAKLKAK